MSEQPPAYWIVIERENGHAKPPIGAILPIQKNFEEAIHTAEALLVRFPDKKFAVLKAVAELHVRKSTVTTNIEEENPQ